VDKGKKGIVIKRILVYGIVQGVGFRPFVYSLAERLGIVGTVCNLGGIVEIIAAAPEDVHRSFLKELRTEEGKDYEIHAIEAEEITKEHLTREQYAVYESGKFVISTSTSNVQGFSLTPDIGLCKSCASELVDKVNRRYLHPFISCAACGPRYTILEHTPYDRDTTVMKEFPMCEACNNEYTTASDRRFHAETISCMECGPVLRWEEHIETVTGDSFRAEGETALTEAIKVIRAGGIAAVKGIGGFHYVCSPFMNETVQKLRLLKGREKKPFAICFPDMDILKTYAKVTTEEEKLLCSKARPIVLLYEKERKVAAEVSGESIYLGAFLPYTPIQLLLTKELGPLIMTSANLSGKPIIRENSEMLSIISPYLRGVLYHDREILRSVDDSVVKVVKGKKQIIRRSRGYAPYPILLPKSEMEIFAAGGDLKASFSLYKDGRAVLSQYFGDLEEYDILEEYQKAYEELKALLFLSPKLAVCDLHPGYHSTEFTKGLALPVLQVQHHHAHIASVMAEHNLKGKVLGIAFDGTGYGTDGNIWGGEFLLCEGGDFTRVGHLSYTPLMGGDASLKDAGKTALCYLLAEGLSEVIKDDRTALIKAALTHGTNTILSSSMGRLFDAVSALLGICTENRYEGEAAVLLEQEARKALMKGIAPVFMEFDITEVDGIYQMKPGGVIRKLAASKDIKSKGALSLGFHYAIAEAVLCISGKLRRRENISAVALSGGVFANSLLLERVTECLFEEGFQVYRNEAVPPGDGGISLGQTYIGLQKYEKETG
jgi:hydrogenase maturation protein HypF